MLSRCFHFGVFEIFVSSLFLLVVFAFGEYLLSAHYNSKADSQEEDYDGRLCRIILLPVALLLFYGVNLELYATIKIM